ncbi:MAG: phosphate regulon transcriptional regulator PhoB [Pseudomonadota bacterium]
MRTRSLLVVDDEPAVREMVADTLRTAGFIVREAGNVAGARAMLADEMPDLLLLDWMLPDTSGIEFLRLLRSEDDTRALPVIMLTARGDEPDRVRGLNGGADDYIGKPFSLRELEARIRALLRRSPVPDEGNVLAGGRLKLDTERYEVWVDSDEVLLGPTEFRLLQFLMRNPRRVYSRSQLLDEVWGQDAYIEERTVDVHIRRLRMHLEPHDADSYVQTVRGVGYRFSAE